MFDIYDCLSKLDQSWLFIDRPSKLFVIVWAISNKNFENKQTSSEACWHRQQLGRDYLKFIMFIQSNFDVSPQSVFTSGHFSAPWPYFFAHNLGEADYFSILHALRHILTEERPLGVERLTRFLGTKRGLWANMVEGDTRWKWIQEAWLVSMTTAQKIVYLLRYDVRQANVTTKK